MAQNRYMLISTDICEPGNKFFNNFILFDSYKINLKPYKLENLDGLNDTNKFYGQIKKYIPFISSIGLCNLNERFIHPYSMRKEYESSNLFYNAKEISNICAYKTHTIGDEHKILNIYNELKAKNSNLITKHFSENNYKKYLDEQLSTNDTIALNIPNNLNLKIKDLETNKKFELYVNNNVDANTKPFIIENLELSDLLNNEIKLNIQIDKDIIINNLYAPNSIVSIMGHGYNAYKHKLLINNIECGALTCGHNYINNIGKININKIKINNFSGNNKIDTSNIKECEINDIIINTKNLISIDDFIKINNIIGDSTKIIKKRNYSTSDSVNYICKDKIFVITGAISGWTRDNIIYYIEKNGGKVSSTITNKTDYLLCENISNSSKSKKALQYETTIISGETLKNFLNGLKH